MAVVPMMTDSTCCLAASYEAKAFGVKTGVRVYEAKRLCPGLILVKAQHHLYVRYHHLAIEAIESCLPVHSVCSIDEICCELTGSHRQLNVAQDLVKKIKETLAERLGTSLTVSIGLGPNILLSKMAADMKKPNGLTWIKKEELPNKLFSLSLRDVPGIGQKMEYRLNQNKIKSMEQLLSLSEHEMRGVWGSVVGARYYHLFKGESFQQAKTQQKSLGHEHVLPPSERNFTSAGIVLQKLLVKAAVRLRRNQWMCRRLSIYVRFLSGQKWFQEISFLETQDTSFLIKHLLKNYELCSKIEKPIKVSITLSDFIPETQHQYSFFTNEKKSAFFKTVDKINEKYGKDTLYLGSLHEHRESAPTRIAFSRIPELDELEEVY